jgi:hypothetical protein
MVDFIYILYIHLRPRKISWTFPSMHAPIRCHFHQHFAAKADLHRHRYILIPLMVTVSHKDLKPDTKAAALNMLCGNDVVSRSRQKWQSLELPYKQHALSDAHLQNSTSMNHGHENSRFV